MKTLQDYIKLAEALEAFPFVWFNKDTEEYECKTDEAAKWFITHHNEILTALQAQGRRQSAWASPSAEVDVMAAVFCPTKLKTISNALEHGKSITTMGERAGFIRAIEDLKIVADTLDKLSAAPPVTAPIEKVDGLAEALAVDYVSEKDPDHDYCGMIIVDPADFDALHKAARLQLQRQGD